MGPSTQSGAHSIRLIQAVTVQRKEDLSTALMNTIMTSVTVLAAPDLRLEVNTLSKFCAVVVCRAWEVESFPLFYSNLPYDEISSEVKLKTLAWNKNALCWGLCFFFFFFLALLCPLLGNLNVEKQFSDSIIGFQGQLCLCPTPGLLLQMRPANLHPSLQMSFLRSAPNCTWSHFVFDGFWNSSENFTLI